MTSTAFERVARIRGIEPPKVRRPHLSAVPETPIPAPEKPAHRPIRFADIIGQEALTMRLSTHVRSAVTRGTVPGHVLLDGPPGCGKTTLAQAMAGEMATQCHELTGDAIMNATQLAQELAKLSTGDVLLIDEAQALRGPAQTALLKVLEDRVMYVPGSAKRPAIRFDVPEFTMVTATSHPGKLAPALRSRFKITGHVSRYDADDLGLIALGHAERIGADLDADAALALAGAARGIPRRVTSLVEAARDYSIEVTQKVGELIDEQTALQALEYGEISPDGLEARDIRYLDALVHTFNGGPVGAGSLAGVLGVDMSELTADIESYLIEVGLLDRRTTGRCCTEKTYGALGLPTPPILCGWR